MHVYWVASVVSDSGQPYGLQPTSLVCPQDFPGKNTGVGCHILLQGIFLTQEWNPCLLRWQADSLPLYHLGRPLLVPKERKRDGKNSKGQKRSERERMAEQWVPLAQYRSCNPPRPLETSVQLPSAFWKPFHSVSLARTTERICLKYGSGEADMSPFFTSGYFPMIPERISGDAF